jgi:hypothetical protein
MMFPLPLVDRWNIGLYVLGPVKHCMGCICHTHNVTHTETHTQRDTHRDTHANTQDATQAHTHAHTHKAARDQVLTVRFWMTGKRLIMSVISTERYMFWII